MKSIINTKNAPKAIGPYSQAIKVNKFLVTSGQIPINNTSGKIPEEIKEQTYITLINIKSIVEASGLAVKDIIKTTIFTTNLKNFDIINQVYKDFFLEHHTIFPARSCIEVQALPKNVQIEIEAIAYGKSIN